MAKTESISDERLAEYASDNSSLYNHHEFPLPQIEEIRSMATELQSLRTANSDGGVEPVAWRGRYEGGNWQMCIKDPTPYEVYDEIQPLYAHPPAKALDGIAVTDEMVERAVAAMKESFCDAIANSADMPFTETGVTLPSDLVWDRYSRAALTAALK